jgi:short-subunit dehydrogenase
MTSLTEQRIILTGATGGIGSELAKQLLQYNCKLALVGRSNAKLELLITQLKAKKGQVIAIAADITLPEGREKIVAQMKVVFGGHDMLINTAGLMDFTSFVEQSDERIEAVFATNVIAPMQLCKKVLPYMLAQNKGHIVNIGSTFGSIGYPGSTVYCASKFGIRGFSEALNRELDDTLVSVSYFAPRATKTAINNDGEVAMNNELGTKMDTAEQVASAFIDFLKSQKSRYYMGWPEKLFVRINSVLPSIVDKSIIKQLPIIKHYL